MRNSGLVQIVPAGYHLHPATLDAAFQAAQLASSAAASADAADLLAAPLRQQLASLRSFAPAAGSSSSGSSSGRSSGLDNGRMSAAPICIGVDAAAASLQTATGGEAIAQLRGFGFAEGRQLGGTLSAAVAEAQRGAEGSADFTYQTVWSVDNPEAPTPSSFQAAAAAARHHRISFAGPAAGRRRFRLRVRQPPVMAATALLAALQHSAASRDQQVKKIIQDCLDGMFTHT